ncbi:MAG: hypothetical protein LBK71_06860, partial [Verrucomicrobiales bacterium]|nr:hypothetical protein [Verrucomicrobiales bacterium]
EGFPCWDEQGLWDIQVPGSWKSQFQELKWYDGHAVYLKQFDAPQLPADHEAFLCFDGALYTAEVIFNGHRLAVHDWGYSAFQVRVTEVLREHNELFVLVENLLKHDRVPGEIEDWMNDGGLINGVKLIYVPVTHIENFRTSTRLAADSAVIDVEIFLAARDASASEEVTVSVPELNLTGKVIVSAGQSAHVTLSVPRGQIRLWSPADPKLYRTELKTRFETISDDIGYRELKTAGRQILLNGEPIRLYGVCMHSEFPKTGRTATPEALEKLVAVAKDLGINFLRCAHYPYAEIFGRALDKAGILWWEEVPAYWMFHMREEYMTRLATGMLEETIRRDWNRASLAMWSVSNECCWRNPENPQEENYAYWRKAAALVRRLDPSRLLTCAEAQNLTSANTTWDPSKGDLLSLGAGGTEDKTFRPMHSDEFYHLFDVLAGNCYVGKPGDEREHYARYVKLFLPYNKPLMLSEFGSQSLYGDTSPDDRLGSAQRHITMIEAAYHVFEELPELTGYAPWVLADGRAPIHWSWYNKGTGLFRFGFLNEEWQPKPVYATLKNCIAKLKQHFTR